MSLKTFKVLSIIQCRQRLTLPVFLRWFEFKMFWRTFVVTLQSWAQLVSWNNLARCYSASASNCLFFTLCWSLNYSPPHPDVTRGTFLWKFEWVVFGLACRWVAVESRGHPACSCRWDQRDLCLQVRQRRCSVPLNWVNWFLVLHTDRQAWWERSAVGSISCNWQELIYWLQARSSLYLCNLYFNVSNGSTLQKRKSQIQLK